MAKNNNLTDLLKSVADAIRAKKGTTDLINPQNFDAEIASIPSGGSAYNMLGFTGHIDEAGLRRLNWNDNDIAWLQKVCWWNEEDDNDWKVSEVNISKGALITWDNYKTYQNDRDIIFFPKLGTPTMANKQLIFDSWHYVYAIPTDGWVLSGDCFALFFNSAHIASCGDLGSWDTSAITRLNGIIQSSFNVRYLGDLSQWNTANFYPLTGFYEAKCLVSLGDLSGWNVPSGASYSQLFRYCRCLVSLGIPRIVAGANTNLMFSECDSLRDIIACGTISASVSFSSSPLLTHKSLLTIFNALDPDNVGTITLHANAKLLLTDEDKAIATSKGWTIA